MIYNFLTDEDIEVAIKEDMLDQVTDGNATNIIKAEAAAVSYMSDFLRDRFDVTNVFPRIPTWASNKQYKKSIELTYTGTDQNGVDIEINYTPIYYRPDSDEIVNVVYYAPDGKFYIALADNTNTIPSSDPAKWKEQDPRDEKIVGFCTDIALFYLHRRINPRQLPQLRVDMYNQAKEWLTWVKDNELNPDLPKNIDIKKGKDIAYWGSGPINGHYY